MEAAAGRVVCMKLAPSVYEKRKGMRICLVDVYKRGWRSEGLHI